VDRKYVYNNKKAARAWWMWNQLAFRIRILTILSKKINFMKGPTKIDFSSKLCRIYSPVTQTLIQHFHRNGLIIVNRGKE
jgi:hypothetical protein